MKDSTRENLSYFGIYKKLLGAKKDIVPEKVSFGEDKFRYFLFYEPSQVTSDKIIFWIHGGGWNAGSPKFFDYVGQCIAKAGYRCVLIGYRHSPKNKYPAQIEDVCCGYNAAVKCLKDKGIDVSKIIVAGPSAGAHLSSILCYSESDQERYSVDISNVIGFIGSGGPYSFDAPQTGTLKTLLKQLFAEGYDRKKGEPASLMTANDIPMLLIQSEHDGLIDFECARIFAGKASALGIKNELYRVVDEKNTHSWYTAGIFLLSREENKCLDKFFSFIEGL